MIQRSGHNLIITTTTKKKQRKCITYKVIVEFERNDDKFKEQTIYLKICNLDNKEYDMYYWRPLTDCQDKDKWPNF